MSIEVIKLMHSKTNNLLVEALCAYLQQNFHATVINTTIPDDNRIKEWFDSFSLTGDATLYVFFWNKATSSTIFNMLERLRRIDRQCPFLIMDIDGIDLNRLKKLIIYRNIGVVSVFSSTNDLSHVISRLENPVDFVLSMEQERFLKAVLDYEPELSNQDIEKYNHQERRIIEESVKGRSIKEIAETLGLSRNTVAAYRSKMIKRSGVKSFHQLLVTFRDN